MPTKLYALTGVFLGLGVVFSGGGYAAENNQGVANSAMVLAYYQPYYQSRYYQPRYYRSRSYYQPRYQSRYYRQRDYQPRYSNSRPAESKQRIRGTGVNTFIFEPAGLRWYAYNGAGQLIRSGRASGGKGYCPDTGRTCRTPVGYFRVRSKGGPGCVSSKFPLNRRLPRAPMPYCMHFLNFYAIHGSPDVPNYNASHGCIRVPTSDAYWLSHNFVQHGTRVIVRPYGRR